MSSVGLLSFFRLDFSFDNSTAPTDQGVNKRNGSGSVHKVACAICDELKAREGQQVRPKLGNRDTNYHDCTTSTKPVERVMLLAKGAFAEVARKIHPMANLHCLVVRNSTCLCT